MAAVHMTPAARTDSEAQLAAILKSLDDDKAEDVVQIDLRGRSAMGDYMVICSGRSSRQVSAIAEKLVDRLKQEQPKTKVTKAATPSDEKAGAATETETTSESVDEEGATGAPAAESETTSDETV